MTVAPEPRRATAAETGDNRLLSDPPTYVCKQAGQSITVDGVLSETAWQKAEPIELVLREGTGKPKLPTTAKMLWDNEALYVAFVCTDTDIWATMTQHDDPLWEQEVVEVFIDPTGTADPYFEIQVNPLNVVVDLRLVKSLAGLGKRMFAWNASTMKTAVKTTAPVNTWQVSDNPRGQWTVEMAIPFKDLDTLPHSPPQDGDKWRVNLYRIERPALKKDEDDEYSAWAPTYYSPSYHTVERFGVLVFSAAPVGK
ncbi:MAG: hypothetical protein FJ279_08685 [Planctomycetes bacterium]|nr:hypothetical protein [Planctomycetota bacterium]